MIEWLREYCLSFPGAYEEVQWEDHLLFKVGGKMFVLTALNNEAENILSIKCDPEVFDEITEREGIIPAPYLARNKWISVKKSCSIRKNELQELIKTSYDLVFAKLPKKTQKQLVMNNEQ